MALIMIHRNNTVKTPADFFNKQSIRRKGPLDTQTAAQQLITGRNDRLNLLTTHIATLTGMRPKGYRGRAASAARRPLVTSLAQHLPMRPEVTAECLSDDLCLDALTALLAGHDVLMGRAEAPPEVTPTLLKEGWIWTRRPNGSAA